MDIQGPEAWLNEPAYKLEGDALSAAIAEEIMGWKRVTWEKGLTVHTRSGWNADALEEDVTFLGPASWSGDRYFSRDTSAVMGIAMVQLPDYAGSLDALDEVIDSLIRAGDEIQFQRRTGDKGWWVDLYTDRRGDTKTVSGTTRSEALARAMLIHVRQDAERVFRKGEI